MEKQTVAVLGPGSWGTALSQVLNDNGHEVRLWEISKNKSMKSIPLIPINAISKISLLAKTSLLRLI